jgi:RNA recognition motif-containing protein
MPFELDRNLYGEHIETYHDFMRQRNILHNIGINASQVAHLMSDVEVPVAVPHVEKNAIDQIFTMIIKNVNKTATESFEIEVVSQLNITDHIREMRSVCTHFGTPENMAGIVETLTSAFTLTTKFPFQFYILKKGLQ